MVTLSKKTVYFILLSLVLLSLVFRYPLLDHERNQSDSYFIHGLANYITVHGRAGWTIHALSYIGYYPLSYPSGTPFLLSESGMTAEVPLEAAVLLMGMVLGILQCLASFCFLRLFIARTKYILLGTCLCMASARLVDTTYWIATARGPLTVLILLTILVIIEAGRRSDLRLTLIGALLAISCVSIHHMAVFLLLFALAQIVVSIGQSRFDNHGFLGRPSSVAFYGTVAGAYFLLVFGIWEYFSTSVISGLGSTELFDFEPRFLSVVINALAVYSSQIGLIVPLAFLGIPYLFLSRSTDSRRMYPLAVLIFFIPFAGYQLYASLIIAPYLVVLGVNWLRSIRSPGKAKSVTVAVIVLLVVSSMGLPFVMIERWNDKTYLSGDGVIVDPEVFSVASYCEENYGSEISVSNAGVLGGLIWAITGIPFSGGGIGSLLTGEATSEGVNAVIEPSDTGFPRNIYSWYGYHENPLVVHFGSVLMKRGIEYLCDGVSSSEEFRDYLASHSRLVVYIDNNWPDSLVTVYSERNATFPAELRNSESASQYTVELGSVEFAGYLVYETGRSSVYIVQLPIPSF